MYSENVVKNASLVFTPFSLKYSAASSVGRSRKSDAVDIPVFISSPYIGFLIIILFFFVNEFAVNVIDHGDGVFFDFS